MILMRTRKRNKETSSCGKKADASKHYSQVVAAFYKQIRQKFETDVENYNWMQYAALCCPHHFSTLMPQFTTSFSCTGMLHVYTRTKEKRLKYNMLNWRIWEWPWGIVLIKHMTHANYHCYICFLIFNFGDCFQKGETRNVCNGTGLNSVDLSTSASVSMHVPFWGIDPQTQQKLRHKRTEIWQ